MSDERVEPTKEWLDALIENLEDACGDCEPYNDGGDKPYVESCDKHKAMWELRDAILASQPERVECPTNHCAANGLPWIQVFSVFGPSEPKTPHCPDCGQSLKGAGE